MMYDAFKHKFRNERGLLISVPTDKCRTEGERIVKAVLKRWTPPNYFFHFQPGGHMAAGFTHLSNVAFARLDIASFFDSVGRSKVHRTLRRLGFSQKDAWDVAVRSTVKKDGLPGYSLPFGFVQSPILASAALDLSALGAAFLASSAIRLSVYVDDILLSAADERELGQYVSGLRQAAAASGYQLHTGKAQLGTQVEAFNLRLSNGDARITDERMRKFVAVERTAQGLREAAIIRYVQIINPEQAEELKAIYGVS